jgi:peptidoglycan/LPS O-acetylase OafA/YrhL
MNSAILSAERSGAMRGKLPSLDGVRAISFLIVFVAHAGLDWIVPGRFGVDIFFLLSGYLITFLLIREYSATGAISLKHFYMRRALRIFPPMYVILGCTLLLLSLSHQMAGITWAGVSSQLFYYQNYFFHPGIIPELGPLWSLAVEEHFYIIFPPLMVLLLARSKDYRSIASALIVLCGIILVWRCCVVAFMPEGMRWARDASDTRADSILCGCVLACLQQTPLCDSIFQRKRLERYIIPGCLGTLLLTFLVRNPIFRETIRYTLQGLALAPLLYYVVHYPETHIGRLLNTRVLSYIGVLSYSLYLLHAVVLLQMQRIVHGAVVIGLLSLAVTIALGVVVRILIEKPAEKLRGRLRYRRPPARLKTRQPAVASDLSGVNIA